MSLAPGQLLQNRYRIVSPLGQGGMGAVYRAWDTRLDIPAAIKEMTPQPGLDAATLDGLRRQFRQEATILARLDHPHLVEVSDFFEEEAAEGGSVYLVMKYVEGESMAARIAREGALPAAEVLAWGRQLLDALAYCHEQGVIHRDVKPQNVIIRPDGRAVLVDFGLVKLWDPHAPETRTAMRGFGTPEYAPPEQYDAAQAGPDSHTDARSDIYALGATLYHALTGHPPPTATMRVVRPAALKPLGTRSADVPAAVEAAIMRALALRPEERFQSAREMARALESALHEPTQHLNLAASRMPTAPLAAPPLARRRGATRWLWAAGGLLAAILVCALLAGGAAWASRRGGAFFQPTPRATATLTAAASDARPVIVPENAEQVVELARRGRGVLTRAAYSPDGKFLVIATTLGLYLYDAQTLEEIRLIEVGGAPTAFAFSPDGATLAVSVKDSPIQLRRAADGVLSRKLEGFTGLIASLAFSPGGQFLASGAWDGNVRLWRVSDGALFQTMNGHERVVWAVAFSPDGRMVGSASNDQTARLWRVEDGGLVCALTDHTDSVNAIAFSPDGEIVATGSSDDTTRLWRASDCAPLRTLAAEKPLFLRDVTSLAFSPDGETLAVGAWDRTVRLWNVREGALARTLEGHGNWVTSVSFSADGRMLASAGLDNTVRVWQVETGAPERIFEDFSVPIKRLDLSPDGRLLALQTAGKVVLVLALSPGVEGVESRYTLDHANTVEAIAFSPDGALLATVAQQEVRFWQMRDGSILRTFESPKGWLKSVAFSPDGAMLAAGTSDGPIYLWRAADKTLIGTLEGHEKAVTALAFSPDGAYLASASADDTARLWRVEGWKPLRTLTGHMAWVSSVAFSPDGKLLASGSWDRTVRLWSVPGGAQQRVLERHENFVQSATFSPDGRLVASAGEDGTVRLWRVADGVVLRILEGHTAGVEGVAFTPDGTALVSGSLDGMVRVWGVAGE